MFTIRLSRWLTPLAFTLFAILISNCADIDTPCVFGPGECGEGGSTGGVGGAGGDGSADVVCGGVVCAEKFAGQCALTYGCRPAWDPEYSGPPKCFGWDLLPGQDDNNECTQDTCVNDEWVHTPIDLDDGDPCTVDQCDPSVGAIHTNTCG